MKIVSANLISLFISIIHFSDEELKNKMVYLIQCSNFDWSNATCFGKEPWGKHVRVIGQLILSTLSIKNNLHVSDT